VSLDYPFYEELVRRGRRAAWWWLVGDRLYYLCVLPAMLAVPGTGIALLAGLFGFGWGWLVAAVFVAGASQGTCLRPGRAGRHRTKVGYEGTS
jgi:hypothetical protein